MIGIIDYGMGNLRSVEKAFASLGHEVFVSSDVASLLSAQGLVLPGVGAFGDAMRELGQRGLIEPIRQWVGDGKPFLGICLGCQLLLDKSEESPGIEGLGIIPGEVVRFPDNVKIPHMGWNDVAFRQNHPILEGVGEEAFFYFVHSYYLRPRSEKEILMVTEYGSTFVSALASEKLAAFQFHPEKSSSDGLRLLENFAAMCRSEE